MEIYVIIRVFEDCDMHYELFDNIYFTSEEQAKEYMQKNCNNEFEDYYITKLIQK